MGGKGGSKVKITRFYESLYYGLCTSADAVRKITYGEKTIWKGLANKRERHWISNVNLNGGDKKEGGVEGFATFFMGDEDQVLFDSLAQRLTGKSGMETPGFRGITSVFFTGEKPYDSAPSIPGVDWGVGWQYPSGGLPGGRGRKGFYWAANSPYLKDLAFEVERYPRQLDPTTAKIPRTNQIGRTSFYFALDGSGSMFDDPARIDALKTGMGPVLDYLSGIVSSGIDLDIGMAIWGPPVTKLEYKHASVANIATMKAYVQGLTASGRGTDFGTAANAAMAWFQDSVSDSTIERRTFIFLTDGQPSPVSSAQNAASLMADPLDQSSGAFSAQNNTAVDMFGINLVYEDTQYTAMLDNTTTDGVPVVTPENSNALMQAVFGAVFGGDYDANPAHIIYECLIDTSWGMGESEANIDKDSFLTASNTLYGESLGISLGWKQESTIEDFVNEVLGHIEGVLFTDPHSGLLTLRLTRGDYDPDNLPVIDADHCTITSFSRKAWGETVNEVKVTWTNPVNEQAETVTVQDLGSIATQGSLISTTQNYYGVRSANLAMKLAARDLRSMSYPISSVEMDLDRSGWALTPMAVVKVNYPEYGLDDLVMRVGNIDYGKPGSGKIHVSLVEDIFSLPFLAYSQPPTTQWHDPSVPPASADNVLIMPAPYFGLAAALGEETPDVESPETYATVLVAAPNNATFSYDLMTPQTLPNGNMQWAVVEPERSFTSQGLLGASLPAEPTSRMPQLRQDSGGELGLNYFVLFGFPSDDPKTYELALVSNTDSQGWPILQRGILDTIPRRWPVGTPVWYGEPEGFEADPTPRIDGGTAKYRILTRTALGALDLDNAPDETEAMSSRASLPFRPADVRLNGISGEGNTFPVESYPLNQPVTLNPAKEPTVYLSWANRDRLTEDSQILSWNDGNVPPEDGATVSVRVYDITGENLLSSEDSLAGTELNLSISSASLQSPDGIKVCLGAKRGDDVSWVENQCFDIRFGQKATISSENADQNFSGWTRLPRTASLGTTSVSHSPPRPNVVSDSVFYSTGVDELSWMIQEQDIPGENAADDGDVIFDLTAWASSTDFPDNYAYIGVFALDDAGAWLGGRLFEFANGVDRWAGAHAYFPIPFGARRIALAARFARHKAPSSEQWNCVTSLRGHYRNGETNYVLYAGGSNPVAGWSAAGATLAASTPSGDPGWGVPQLDITVGSDSGAATLLRTVDLPTGILDGAPDNVGKYRCIWSAGLSTTEKVAARLRLEYLDGSGNPLLTDYSASDLAHSTEGEVLLAVVDTPMEAIPAGVKRIRFGVEVAKIADTDTITASLNWMMLQIVDYSGNAFVGDNVRATESNIYRETENEKLRVVEGGDVTFPAEEPTILQSAILHLHPVAFWPMNEASIVSTMHDVSGNGLNTGYLLPEANRGIPGGPFKRMVTYQSATTADRICENIANDILRIAGDITVLVVAGNLTPTDTDHAVNYLVSEAEAGDSKSANYIIGLGLKSNGQAYRFFEETGAGTDITDDIGAVAAPNSDLHLLCYTRSGTTRTMYADGDQVGQVTGQPAPSGGSSAKFVFGCSISPSGEQRLNGNYAGVAIFDRALSASEIAELADAFNQSMSE